MMKPTNPHVEVYAKFRRHTVDHRPRVLRGDGVSAPSGLEAWSTRQSQMHASGCGNPSNVTFSDRAHAGTGT